MINLLNIIRKLKFLLPKSEEFDKKIIYFAGCGGINKNVIKILNKMNIEVITPNFSCCGYPFFVRGDMDSFREYADKFSKIMEKYDGYDVITNCATCEKTLKLYAKHCGCKNICIKNVFEYIRENNLQLELKKNKKVTFHKPCNLKNIDDVCWVLKNTKNLEYKEMKDYNVCCGLEGITNIKEYKIMSKLFKQKHDSIIATEAKTVLTSCLACQITLGLFSKNKYKIQDFIDFLAKNID